MTPRAAIPAVIDRHAEDAAFLWLLRDAAARAPNYDVNELAELDNRLDAHLDGLRIAGQPGWEVCAAALASGEPGEVFAAGVMAFNERDGKRIDRVLAAAEGAHETFRALVSALGWQHRAQAWDLIQPLLQANDPGYRRLAVAGCAIHRLDPGPALATCLTQSDPQLCSRALRAAGELGRRDLLHQVLGLRDADDADTRFWAVWSAVLLGDTGSLPALKAYVHFNTDYSERALRLAVAAGDRPATGSWLRALAQDPTLLRFALIGAGLSGDPVYLPTLIKHLSLPDYARIAGEAFSSITGADLAYLDLDGEWPEGFQAGPTEDPEDETVTMDADQDLPWPDPARVEAWWQANAANWQPGQQYLCGKAISPTQCREVLHRGTQRQRQAAALAWALRAQNGALFETRAPGFLQVRQLQTPPWALAPASEP